MMRSRHIRHQTSPHADIKLPQMCESSFIKNPEHQKAKLFSICSCNLCVDNYVHKEINKTEPISNSIIVENQDKTHLEVLLSSVVGKNKKKGLNIDIPETCFYRYGKPETMYYNSHQEIKAMNTKRFSNRQVLKEFLKRRKEAKQNFQKLLESNRQFFEVHEKYFEKIKPSYKESIKENELEEKIYKVHRDSEFEILEDNDQSHEEACVAHFSDGTSILLNEGQFGSIKNNYPHFHSAEYIQALIPCVETVVSEFNQYSCITHKDLYNKARTEVQILLGEISASNSTNSVDEIEQLYSILKITPSTFALYETFKIIHYISKMTETIIYSLKLKWSITKDKHYYLLNVMSMNYRKREAKEIKKLLSNQLEILKNKNSLQAQQIQSMQEMMVQRWRSLKEERNIHCEQIIIKSPVKSKPNSSLFKSSISMLGPKTLPKITRQHSLFQSQLI